MCVCWCVHVSVCMSHLLLCHLVGERTGTICLLACPSQKPADNAKTMLFEIIGELVNRLVFIVDYSFDQNKFISTMRSLVALVSQLTIKLTSNNKGNRNHLMDVSESNQKSLICTAVSM